MLLVLLLLLLMMMTAMQPDTRQRNAKKSNTKKHTLARDKHTPELIESISNLPQLIVPLNTGRHREKDLTTETFWRPLRWRFVAHSN